MNDRAKIWKMRFAELRHAVFDYIKKLDKFLILLAFICSIYGCILIDSAIYNQSGYSRTLPVQMAAVVVGMIAMIILSAIDYGYYKFFWPAVSIVCLCLLILTLIIGTGREGADDSAWIRLGPVSIQPSEFVKLGFAITFSCHCAAMRDRISSLPSVILLCAHAAIPLGLVVLQKDLGTATVFLCLFITMMYVSGVKLRYFAAAGIAALVAIPVGWFFLLNDFHRARFLIAYTPEADPLGMGYQQYFGRMAIGSGQLKGLGLKNGIQSQSGFISESQNDYIFAVAGEELGFLGAGLILLLLTLLIIRIIIIGFNAKNTQGRVLCLGIAAMFAFQTVINVGMCLCLLPVIGVTLPFFSAGGSSMLTCFAAIGLVESVRIYSQPVKLQSGGTIIPK